MKLRLPLVVCIMVVLFAGCATQRTPPDEAARRETPAAPEPEPQVPPAQTQPEPRTPPPEQPGAGEGLLKYFEYVRKLPPAELAKEHDRARQFYAAARSDYNRARYAVVVSVPGAAFYDEARALDAIDPLLKNQNSAMHAFAYMLSTQIQEQRRGQGLQQKLDALKSLDKSLIERESGSGGRRR